MGKEVNFNSTSSSQMELFQKKIIEETELLKSWFDKRIFSSSNLKTGIELEAWLVDENMLPDPYSFEFLERLNHKQIVPEIAKFNFEINSNPYDFSSNTFSSLEKEMTQLWELCSKQAKADKRKNLLIGTLPTLRGHMLEMKYLSPQNRYAIMNEAVMRMRDRKPMFIKLEGREQLHLYMDSVIAECAATSLQIHLGVTQDNAKRYYNASLIASSFLVAISANAPYFFGKEVWDESRIAVFEQSVDLDAKKVDGQIIKRVTLGAGFVKNSMLELFEENAQDYPILLPEVSETSRPEDLSHLRLHNGTIWRWTRPIIGDDGEGNYHLRIEQRTPSAGPTVVDSIANSAFYIGLVDYFANMESPLEDQLSYADVVKNFYASSKQSLYSKIHWIDGKDYPVRELLELFFPHVKDALLKRGVDPQEVKYYMDEIIHPRIKKTVNGAIWQKAFIHMHGRRFQELLEVYSRNQESEKPVHEWEL